MTKGIASNINILQRKFISIVVRRLKAIDLGWGQIIYLKVLHEHGALSQDQISHFTGMDKATTTRTMAKMEDLGLVQREKDAQDHRKNIVSLTEKGVAIGPQILTILDGASDELFQGMDPQDLKMLSTLLKKAVAKL